MNLLKKSLIINFAPTGMVPTKSMTPHVPINVQEIIEQTHEADEDGITLVHLHARDEDGLPTYKSSVYSQIVEGLRKYCPELVICISLSGRNFNELEKRSEVLELGIDMGSLTLSSMNFARQASVNEPEMIMSLCERMKAVGTHPELEVFDLGMVNYSKYLIQKGYLVGPLYYNIILGNIAGMQVDAQHIGAVLSDLPSDALWALGGIGQAQLNANMMAVALGGGVRVGLEDNIYLDVKRQKLATNMDLLKRVHRLAEEAERPIMASRTFGELGFYNNFRNG
jgi:uncharacterized protein (DUF849 family)